MKLSFDHNKHCRKFCNKVSVAKPWLVFLISFLWVSSRLGAQSSGIPVKPEIQYVSIDSISGNTRIFWLPSPSTDVAKYYIYYEVNTPSGPEGVKLDSTDGSGTSYSYLNPGLPNQLYSVTAVDSQQNESTRKPGLHKAVGLNLFYDSCRHTMNLNWNTYVGWGITSSGYKVLRKTSSTPWQVIQGLNKTDSAFIEFNIAEDQIYYYAIEAVNTNSLRSLSNIVVKSTRSQKPPDILLTENVSMIAPGEIRINYSFDNTGEIRDFLLMRSSNKSADFLEIDRSNNVAPPGGEFTDQILNGTDRYYYRIGAVNTCANIVSQSNIGVNILLQADTSGQDILLFWNPYEEWLQGSSSCRVYRMDDSGEYQIIAELPATSSSYSDNPASYAKTGYTGLLRYKVEYLRSDGLYNAVSNQLEVRISSDISLLPDAFTPNGDGKNEVFRPIFDFAPSKFLMIIVNRSGVEVYRSEDPWSGWDGSMRGKEKVQEGVYVYFIRYTSFNGVKKEVKGHVTVFYP